jgi:acetylornithine deacetylase/succinyl-diaminopimelate desuccinylase-like protein
VQTSEKVSVTFRLEVKDRGGHSSVPRTDNAIYHLADGLARLAKFNFPLNLNATTRVYFEETAKLESTQTAADIRSVLSGRPEPASLNRLYADPAYNAQLHTTCVATMLQGGHAYNALPQTASAMVNCRVMPGEPIEGVRATLARVLADERISLNEVAKPVLSMPSALNSELSSAIQKTSEEIFPGVPVVPIMSAGATDGSYLRNAGIPTYGHSGLASDVDDVRAHGQDERVARASFFQGQDYLYRLVKRLAGPQAQ